MLDEFLDTEMPRTGAGSAAAAWQELVRSQLQQQVAAPFSQAASASGAADTNGGGGDMRSLQLWLLLEFLEGEPGAMAEVKAVASWDTTAPVTPQVRTCSCWCVRKGQQHMRLEAARQQWCPQLPVHHSL